MFALFLACAAPDADLPAAARATTTPGASGRGSADAKDVDPARLPPPGPDTGGPDTGGSDTGGPDTGGDGDGDGVLAADDCDDGDATVFPGATEVCRDGVDQDCDGADARCLTGNLAADMDGDAVVAPSGEWSTASAAYVGDADGDGVGDLLVGTLEDHTADIFAGAAWLVPGPIRGEISVADAPVALYGERESDWFGWAIGAAGDTDGDGRSDLLVGAPGVRSAAYNAGAAYLFAGVAAGVAGADAATAAFEGEAEEDSAGTSVTGAGDTDGDGFDDLVVMATEDDVPGLVYVVRCPCAGTTSLADADLRWTATDRLPYPVFAADLTDDGAPELFVYDEGAETVWVVPGSLDGDHEMTTESVAKLRNPESDNPGAAFAAGDLDGDGQADLAWGGSNMSPVRYQEGRVMVFAGPLAGTLVEDDAFVTVRSDASRAGSGADVAVGDLDGDGADDLLVTNPHQQNGAGDPVSGVFGLYGPLSGAYLALSVDVAFLGSRSMTLGQELELGDLDADGFPDVVAGADRGADYTFYVVQGGP